MKVFIRLFVVLRHFLPKKTLASTTTTYVNGKITSVSRRLSFEETIEGVYFPSQNNLKQTWGVTIRRGHSARYVCSPVNQCTQKRLSQTAHVPGNFEYGIWLLVVFGLFYAKRRQNKAVLLCIWRGTRPVFCLPPLHMHTVCVGTLHSTCNNSNKTTFPRFPSPPSDSPWRIPLMGSVSPLPPPLFLSTRHCVKMARKKGEAGAMEWTLQLG